MIGTRGHDRLAMTVTTICTIGIGSLLGSWLAAPVERRLGRVRTLVLSVVVNAAGLVVPVVTALSVPIGAAWLATGAAIVLWNVVTVSLRQRITPDRLLGRMNASYRLVGWGTMPLGALLGGILLFIINTYTAQYVGPALTNAMMFLVLVLMLMVRPYGLLGNAFGGSR